MQQKQSTSIVWFTDNLRARDNFVLSAAMKASRRVIGVYFLTPERFNETQFGFKKTEKFRAKFLLQTLNDLKSELDALNISLLVFNTAVEKQMRELVKIYDVKAVYHQKEWTDEEVKKIDSLKKILPANVSVHEYYDQFLFHPDDLTFHYSETPKGFYTV
jgi:deoxyribodipyrimidine photo-lyase